MPSRIKHFLIMALICLSVPLIGPAPSLAAGMDILGPYFKGWPFGRGSGDQEMISTTSSSQTGALPYDCSYIYVVRGENSVRQRQCAGNR